MWCCLATACLHSPTAELAHQPAAFADFPTGIPHLLNSHRHTAFASHCLLFPSCADLFGGMPIRFGTFLAGIELFDAAALGVSDSEATLMDPQQRLLLEAVGELLLGSPELSAAGRASTGAFVGLSSTDYAKVGSCLGSAPLQLC